MKGPLLTSKQTFAKARCRRVCVCVCAGVPACLIACSTLTPVVMASIFSQMIPLSSHHILATYSRLVEWLRCQQAPKMSINKRHCRLLPTFRGQLPASWGESPLACRSAVRRRKRRRRRRRLIDWRQRSSWCWSAVLEQTVRPPDSRSSGSVGEAGTRGKEATGDHSNAAMRHTQWSAGGSGPLHSDQTAGGDS